MRKYAVFYDNLSIGNLYINDENKYHFIPNENNPQREKLICELQSDNGWTDPIPLLANMIADGEKYGLDEIKKHTNHYVLKKIKFPEATV